MAKDKKKDEMPDIEIETIPEDIEEEKVEDINDQEKDVNDIILELNEEIKKLKNDYAKAYADTENVRKRLTNEAELNKKYRIQSFASEILPVIDNLERALAQEVNEYTEKYHSGIEMIYSQLMNALSKEGVEQIDCLDKPFDANLMQGIATEKVEGKDPDIVLEVFQKGYMLKDRILRPAMVKISE